MNSEHRPRLRAVLPLHLAFAATGMGITLFGCLLPRLHSLWHLTDAHAGALFACQFTGAAVGALLVRANFFRSLMFGYALTALSGILLGFVHGGALGLVLFSFGLGLGWAMTGTSMLVGVMYQSRGSALSLLNASWVAGAVLSPPIVTTWIHRWAPMAVYPALSIVVVAALLWIWLNREAMVVLPHRVSRPTQFHTRRALVAGFAIVAFLYVGVEVSVSGWMMTYVHRLSPGELSWAALITSCFWIALLCGRALAPVLLLRVSELALLFGTTAVALVAVALLLAGRTPGAILLTTVFSGIALGPVLPLCFARVLALTHDSPQSKWVFGFAGLGGSLLSWITGLVSSYKGSLHAGLFVPLLALVIMVLLLAWISRRSQTKFAPSEVERLNVDWTHTQPADPPQFMQ